MRSSFGHDLRTNSLDGQLLSAPVSHQKQPHRNTTNANEIEQKRCKINEADR